jgi:hypothetical protein
MLTVINENDQQFKPKLERYKRAKRFHGWLIFRTPAYSRLQSLKIRETERSEVMIFSPQ